MRDSRTCPKCGYTQILRIEGTVGAHGRGNNITAGMTIFSSAKLPRYICCRCGYLEEWVDTKDLPQIIEFYKKNPSRGTILYKGEKK